MNASPSTDLSEVRPDECEALGELTVRVYAPLLAADEPEYLDELRDVAARAEAATVLVARIDGVLAGGVTYVGDRDNPFAEFSEADAAGIRMLAVAPGAQGRGVGTALVRACLERARDAGKVRVVLHTTPVMHAAHRMYERLGFRRDPARDWRPQPTVALLGYELML